MTAVELRSLLYEVPENSEVVLLNVNAPVRCTEPIKSVFVKSEGSNKQAVFMYGKEKEGKEGTR